MDRSALEIIRVLAVHGQGLRGRGQRVGLCDTGLDTGRPDDLHSAFGPQQVILDGRYRKGDCDDPDGHGTHVAGLIAGRPPHDTSVLAGGVAPEGELFVQSVYRTRTNPFGRRPLRFEDVLSAAYGAGCLIHSNSWVLRNAGNAYTSTAEDIDAFIHSRPDMVVVLGAGNQGGFANATSPPSAGTVCSPATAKNAISVGATENVRHASPTYRDFFPRKSHKRIPQEVLAAPWAENVHRLAAFSGIGPTREGRIKPDLVAPGTAMISTRSRLAVRSFGWGDWPGTEYVLSGGTSTAVPLVAGCAALARQFLIERRGVPTPSAALVKALLIGGAKPIAASWGLPGTGELPSQAAGWGRVDLVASLGLDDSRPPWVLDRATGLRPGEALLVRFPLLREDQPLRACLVWTDPPGRALLSDLDLLVRHGPAGAREDRHGNRPAGATDFDRTNNVERVVLDRARGPVVEVEIRAHRISGSSQPFALVVWGAIADSLPAAPGS